MAEDTTAPKKEPAKEELQAELDTLRLKKEIADLKLAIKETEAKIRGYEARETASKE